MWDKKNETKETTTRVDKYIFDDELSFTDPIKKGEKSIFLSNHTIIWNRCVFPFAIPFLFCLLLLLLLLVYAIDQAVAVIETNGVSERASVWV